MSSRTLQRKIHVACRQLGLDSDARREAQLAATGKSSMKDMGDADLLKMVSHLEQRGFKGSFNKGDKSQFKPAAGHAGVRLVHVLWRKLGEAGALRDPSRSGLNKFIRSRFEKTWQSVPMDVDALRDHKQVNQVINALKDWCAREGVVLKS